MDHEPVWSLYVFVEPSPVPHLTFVLLLEPSLGVSHPPIGSAHRATRLSAALSCGFTSSVHSGAPGNRTPISWVQAKCLPVRPASRTSRGPSGNGTRPRAPTDRTSVGRLPQRRTTLRAVPAQTLTDRLSKVVPDGVEPSFPGCEPSVVAVGPRDRVANQDSRKARPQGLEP